MTYPATIQLAVMFPPEEGLRGACTTIRDLCGIYRFGFSFPNKSEAVRMIARANDERSQSFGNGNRAKRRAHNIKLRRIAA